MASGGKSVYRFWYADAEKFYIIDDPAPNAFATGRDPNHAIVGATTGLLDIMDKRELEAVMAHEMSHVRNYDIRVSMIAFGLVSAIGLFADLALRMMFYSDDRAEILILSSTLSG